MKSNENLILWRAKEIAKLNLLRSSYRLNIEEVPINIYDYIVTVKQNKIRFGIIVCEVSDYNKRITQIRSMLRIYKENGMLSIPVLLMKIDQEREIGELALIVVPDSSNSMKIDNIKSFHKLSSSTIDNLIQTIIEQNKK